MASDNDRPRASRNHGPRITCRKRPFKPARNQHGTSRQNRLPPGARLPGHVGVHVLVLTPSFGRKRASGSHVPHGMVVRLHRSSVLVRQAHEVPTPHARPARLAHVHRIGRSDLRQLGRLHLGRQQRTFAGNEHRLLPLPFVQHPFRAYHVSRAPHAHAEGRVWPCRMRSHLLHRRQRRRHLDFLRAGLDIFRLRSRQEERTTRLFPAWR